jgi:cyanate permease
MDASAAWLATARACGTAFVPLVGAAAAVGVAVHSPAWKAALVALAAIAAATAILSWLGHMRGWRYPLAKRPRELSAAERSVLAQLGAQSFFERPRPSASLRQPRR